MRHIPGFGKVALCRIRHSRHTFASHYMMAGGDLYELAKILGHSNQQEILFSVPVTSAMRTILDTWEEGSLPKEILRQAFQQAKSTGRITQKQATHCRGSGGYFTIDMVLLIRSKTLDASVCSEALRRTFERRGTHDLPAILEPPPAAWVKPFERLAEECRLDPSVSKAFAELSKFYMPLR